MGTHVQTLCNVGATSNSCTNSYTTGLDLSTLANVTASNFRGNYTIAVGSSNLNFIANSTSMTSGNWTIFKTDVTPTSYGALGAGNYNIKVGDSTTYQAGWKVFASASTTSVIS